MCIIAVGMKHEAANENKREVRVGRRDWIVQQRGKHMVSTSLYFGDMKIIIVKSEYHT